MAATFLVALTFIVFFTCPVISGTTYADESHSVTSTTLISMLLGKILVYSVLLAFTHVFLCGCNYHCMVFINHVFLAAYGQ